MQNVLDAAPIAALAQRIAAKIPHQGAATRFARLAFDEMLRDARNFRPVQPDQLPADAAWARRELEAGREVAVFVPHRLATARLRVIARALADTLAEIDHFERAIGGGLRTRQHANHLAAAEFVAKIDRASFDVIVAKARLFARLRKNRLDDLKAEIRLFAGEEVCAAPGRVWRLIVSVAELWALGREFRNCLARRYVGGFGARLRSGGAQFWVLRDQTGKGLAVAMADPLLRRITEVRGPYNRPVSSDDPDLVQLGQARGWCRPNGRSGAPAAPAEAPRVHEILLEILRARARQPN